MRCPRCDSLLDEAAVRCSACGAPLLLAEEPPPPPLDRALDLDRRRSRTPVPAASGPLTADHRQEALGDLSFEPPADDGPWTMTAPPEPIAPEPGGGATPDDPEEPDPQLGAPEVDDGWADDEPPAAEGPDVGPDEEDDLGAIDGEGAGDALPQTVAAGPAAEHVAMRRGRFLSLASLAIAGAAALVAVLSSR